MKEAWDQLCVAVKDWTGHHQRIAPLLCYVAVLTLYDAALLPLLHCFTALLLSSTFAVVLPCTKTYAAEA